MLNNTQPRLQSVAPPAAAAQPPLIEIRGAGKTYHTQSGQIRALDGIDLDIGDGEFVSIVGPSGCGKSTLLRMLAGLDECDEGSLSMQGKEIAGPSPEVGVVFQAANLLPWLTVRQNVALPTRVGGKAGRRNRAKTGSVGAGKPGTGSGNGHGGVQDAENASVDDLLNMTGLGDFGERYPYELSGGMQQRAGICRALVRNPRTLLMDEPFGALDALTRERMNLELQRIWQANSKTVVLITHSISEAIFLADRVIVMSSRPGRVLRDLAVDIPRPRTFDTIISHPEYARLSREIRALLNAQGEIE